MNLVQALQSQPALTGLSDADTLAYGNQTVPIVTNPTLYSYSGLLEIFQAAGVDPSILFDVQSFIKTLVGGASLDVCLLSGMVNFSLPGIQAQLAANLPGESAIHTTAINAMLTTGVSLSGTNWQLWQCPQPVLADITAARATIAGHAAVLTFFNETVYPMLSTGTAMPADYKAAFAAWAP